MNDIHPAKILELAKQDNTVNLALQIYELEHGEYVNMLEGLVLRLAEEKRQYFDESLRLAQRIATPPGQGQSLFSVSLSDFEAAADDNAPQEYKDRLEFARTMTPEEWLYFAGLMADLLSEYVYDPDIWNRALGDAADDIQKLRLGTDGPL